MSRPVLKPLLLGISQVLFVLAGLAFLIGGLIISDVARIDRIFAEMMGIGIAVGLGLLGFIARRTAEDMLEGDDDSSPR
jgi:hypothetical protein